MTTRNIIILPPPEVARQAIEWSQQISKQCKTTFVLDGKQFYPHITLYQAAYPDKNIVQVEQELMLLCKQSKPFRIQAETFSTFVGFVILNFIKTNELLSLHRQIVAHCNPLREGENIPAEVKNLTDSNVPEFIKHSIRTFGSAFAMEAYMPHITLTRLIKLNDAKKAKTILVKKEVSFNVSKIHLANIGLDGTVNEILKEFPFG